MKKGFEVVSAGSLVSAVPTDLDALFFFRRLPRGQTVRMYAVGDIGLSGRVGVTAEREGFSALFQEVAPLLHMGDIVFGNLETPLTNQVSNGPLFAGSPRGASALAKAGFTLLHLANNHIYDYGPEGLVSTLAALHEFKLVPLGGGMNQISAHELVRTDREGLRIGWLGCGRTLQRQEDGGPCFWEFNEAELLTAISQARNIVDTLIVSIHIGFMYLDYPHPEHKAMVKQLFSEGADLILMHHAHVLQGVQATEQGKMVCYNLGNFLLDREEGNVKADVMAREQNEGAIFLFDLDKHGVCTAAALPTWIDESEHVNWAVGARGAEILDRLVRISQDLDGDYSSLFWRQRSERNVGFTLKTVYFHIRQGNFKIVKDILSRIRPGHLSMVYQWLGSALSTVLKNLFSGFGRLTKVFRSGFRE